MPSQRRLPIVRLFCVSVLLAGALIANEPASVADEPLSQADAQAHAAAALAVRIDELIARRWTENNVTPAPLSDDSEFLRRVYLDIAGKIPPTSVARNFSELKLTEKRRWSVDELLDGSGYVVHFTTFWRNVMLPEVNADFQVRFLVPRFDAWLRGELQKNTQYDALVRDILTTPLGVGGLPGGRQTGPVSPIAFFQAKQIAPENLAAATSRIFLGTRIECAECHDHPFDSWNRQQFWSFASFFAGVQRADAAGVSSPVSETSNRRELKIPGTDLVVQAAYLDGKPPAWKEGVSSRATLADWITHQNPLLARTAANRLWGHFFGTGLVDPVDDFSAHNPPSHPELLDLLATQFAEHQYDLKFLIRAITATRTYQLTSRQTHSSQAELRLFARMAVKGLTPDQLFDSLAQATGVYQPFQTRTPFSAGGDDARSEFLETFANEADSPTDRQTTILQALSLMNGGLVANATSLQQSQTLTAIANFPLATSADRIETLYFTALGRAPSGLEVERLVHYVDSGGPKNDSQQALGDVFWALLNSSEFLLNH